MRGQSIILCPMICLEAEWHILPLLLWAKKHCVIGPLALACRALCLPHYGGLVGPQLPHSTGLLVPDNAGIKTNAMHVPARPLAA